MTEALAEMMKKPEEGFDAMDPANISHPWCGNSLDSKDVTGQVFEVAGGEIIIGDGWRRGRGGQGERWGSRRRWPRGAGLLAEATPAIKPYGAQ